MFNSKLLEILTYKEKSKICLLGLPASGKSVLSKKICDFLKVQGYPATIISMVDVLTINEKNQNILLDFYQFVCDNNFVTVIFDGWPYEKPPNRAFASCDQVWLLCLPPWLFLAKRKARGEDVPDTSEFWRFYYEEVPNYLKKHQDSKKFLLIEFKDGIYKPIEDYSQWLELAADPTEEDEKSLLKEIRDREYQSFNLPFGGKINGSDATEKIIRTAVKYLPGPKAIKRSVDVGCEFGKACFMLAQWGVQEVHGIDHDPRCIQIAKKLQKLYYSHADFSVMKGEFYDFNSVDLAICLSVSHHLPEPQYLYSQIMRAKRIVVELPYHKFSILEEASQRLNRECIAIWPSPKRDREVRIYCHPELVPGRIPSPEQELDRRIYLNSGKIKRAGYDDSFFAFLPSKNIHRKTLVGVKNISHKRFAKLSYIPLEGTDTIECDIEYDTVDRDVPVWVQYDWHFQSGNFKMIGKGHRFSGNNRLKVIQSKPWEKIREPLTKVVIVVRPNQGEENKIKINSITIVDRS